ncbi:MAG: glycosyltransferase [Marinomonas sp.]
MMGDQGTNIHVIMAIHDPDLLRLNRQIASILDQQDCRVSLSLFADGPQKDEANLSMLCEKWERVDLTVFPENLGPGATFLAGLERVLELEGYNDSFFAFADQDDIWNLDKCNLSIRAINQNKAAAVHCDMRVVDDELLEIAPSIFDHEMRNLEPTATDLFLRNNATGMTLVFTEQLARKLVELSDLRPTMWLHDHFTAFIALCCFSKTDGSNGLTCLKVPLVDYVQHGNNLVGAATKKTQIPGFSFLREDGPSARYLKSGELLIAGILARVELAPHVEEELHDLLSSLRASGIIELLSTVRHLLPLRWVNKSHYLRLFWSALFSKN